LTPYPKAGDPNPIVKLGVVGSAGGDVTWVDTGRYMPEDLLIVRVGWFPDGKKVWFLAQNREQTFIDFNTAVPMTERLRTCFANLPKPGSE
jgi:dipeptidyl-peptidase-4